MAVIVPFETAREPSIDPLVDLVAADMDRVNATIISRTGSEVTMIPEVANHLINSGGKRMRPMLMTALSACIGLLPAAVSTGIGSQVQRPLATVVVGGMLIGPIMLLVVVPALRMMFLGDEPEQRRDVEGAVPVGGRT